MQGKIIKGIAGFYYVHDGVSEIYECKARGIFRSRGVKPLVGDDVEFEPLAEVSSFGKTGNIVEILPRKNSLIRPAVANIDQALVVFAVADPEPNRNLLDRFLIMMERQGVPVRLVFNKADLEKEGSGKKLRDVYEGAGYEVHMLTALDGGDAGSENTGNGNTENAGTGNENPENGSMDGKDTGSGATENGNAAGGLAGIRRLLAGKTTVLAGPSGVGKSTLTNRLQPQAAMETGAVSEKIRRGRHTTRHSELIFVEPGTFLMDTPGFSSIFVDEIRPEELAGYFPEFARYVPECRFLGCAHMGERECGVKSAAAEGKIAKSRYENYRLIYEELKRKRRY